MIALVALCAAVAQGFGRFSYALLLPAIDRDLLGSYALAGLLATLNVGAYLVGTLAVSALARRVDPVSLLRTGLVASTFGLGLLSQADGAGQVGVGLVLTGVGGAFIWLPGPGLAGSVVPLARRGAAIGLSGSGVGLGIVVASALAAGLQRLQGDGFWRSVWLVETGICLLALVLCLLLLHPAATPPGAPAVRAGALRRVPGWAGVAAAFAAFGLSSSLYTTYVVTALVDDAGFSAARAAADFTLFGVAWIFGGLLLGPLSDRYGRSRTLVLGFVAMTGAVVGLVAVTGNVLLVGAGREPLAAASTLTVGLVMSGLPTVMAAHLSDHLSAREFAGAFSRLTLFFGVAQLGGPPVGGWLAERAGSFTLPFLLAALAAAAGVLVSLTVPERARTGRR